MKSVSINAVKEKASELAKAEITPFLSRGFSAQAVDKVRMLLCDSTLYILNTEDKFRQAFYICTTQQCYKRSFLGFNET